MKRIITSVLLALFIVGVGLSTTNAQSTVPDQIEAGSVGVKLSDGAAVFNLSETPAQLVAAFGKPASTSNAFSEADNTTVNRYNYKDLELYFEGAKLFALKIKGPAVALMLQGKTTVNKGDNITSLATLFPKSYAHREDGQLLIGLKLPDGKATDSSIAFMFDADGVITEIVL